MTISQEVEEFMNALHKAMMGAPYIPIDSNEQVKDIVLDFYQSVYMTGYNECHQKLLSNVDKLLHGLDHKG